MGFRIDLHVHTLHSGDNEAEPHEMVEKAISLGLEGIAFTEHYSYQASGYAENLSEKYLSDILILRGVEISAAEGHLLVFGADTDGLQLGGAPASEVLKAVSELGGLVIPSHPYRRGSSLGDLVKGLKGFAALEGYNGCNLHSMNVMAVEAASSLGVPITGGSDAHAPKEVGSCYTEFMDVIKEDNFLQALKSGRYTGHDKRRVSRKTLRII